MRPYFLLPILLFIFNSTIHSQLSGTHIIRDIQMNSTPGKVVIVQDENIIRLVDRHLFEESKKKGITGYRIRLFSNSGAKAKKEGEIILADFLSRYSKISTHFIFVSPFYRLYVGDFRTRSDAMKFLKSIESIYPDAFIVQSKINYPSL